MRGFELKSNREEESRPTRDGLCFRTSSLFLSLSAEKIICGCPMLAVFAVLEGVEEEGGGRMLRSRRIVDEKTGG